MRETGPIRKELSGDEAVPYIGVARTELGALKERMRMGGLLQGSFSRTLPDGTTIAVRSVFGQDKISVTAPQASGGIAIGEDFSLPEAPTESIMQVAPPVDAPVADSVVVCGTCTDDDATFYRPFIWVPGRDPLELTEMPGSARAHAISGDGQVVVGSFARSISAEGAFMWTKRGGFVDLGDLGVSSDIAGATGVNQDGSVIVGCMHAPADGGGTYPAMFVWTRETGMVLLPGSNGTGFDTPRVSPNGKFICGTYPISVEQWSYTSHGPGPVTLDQSFTKGTGGAVWRKAGTDWQLHPVGFGDAFTSNHTDFFTTLPHDWNIPIPAIPAAINDKGTIAGAAWCGVEADFGASVIDLYPPGATPPAASPVGTGQSSASPTGPLTNWIAGISISGGRVVGNYARSDGDQAWVFTRGRGIIDFHDSAAIYAMAPTGVHFAGAQGDPRTIYHFNIKRTVPMFWAGSGAKRIPLLPGATLGWADGIAVIRVSTDGSV